MPMSWSTATLPCTTTTSPTAVASWLVTVTSLSLPAVPVPSRRWIQFLPMMAALYFTTLPRMVTGWSLRAAFWAKTSAMVRASAPVAFGTFTSPMSAPADMAAPWGGAGGAAAAP